MAQGWKIAQKSMITIAVERMFKELGLDKLGPGDILKTADQIQQLNEEAHQRQGFVTVPQFMDEVAGT